MNHEHDHHNHHMQHEQQPSGLRVYLPLFLVLGGIILVDAILIKATGVNPWPTAMRWFMGLFFVTFGFFKLLDLKGFADAYAGYDIVARRSRVYAFTYPFIELLLGILYLCNIFPFTTNLATAIVMGVSSIGVIQTLARHHTIQCACLGTVIKLPMSTITVIEDVGMGIMALLMLFIM